ncbi:DNA polymerase III subunit gamma/tau [Acidobacteria bacterium AH-259-D05]|nr:DNA polymerase III subunit gamma/tau [Acidobacteria bacterium AH-259-D05]
MSYQVLARKWRPQRFEEVVGQEIVTKTLRNAIESDRMAHAFLFAGIRGVGKTTTARILAKALNCRNGPTPSPCGECDPCQEIAATNSVDVLEIDAASNTGVDSIRELRESVRYGTARDRFKIFIIDEAHMLSKAAFNALLKTLEEPPSHVKFILATTQYDKIPGTIISRCQQFDFKPIPFRLMIERLKLISQEEGIEISEYSLKAIVSTAQGSMRDAQSALDQVMAFAGKQVSDEDVRTLLGVVDEQAIIALVDAVIQQDTKALLEQVEDLTNSGVEPQNFCRKLIHHVRNLMICQVTGWDEGLLNLADTEKDALLHQAEKFSQLDLIRFYDTLNRTENELRWNSHPWVHLELTLMKLVELTRLPSVEEVIDQLRSGGALVTSPSDQPAQPGLFQRPDKPVSGEVQAVKQPKPPVLKEEKEEKEEKEDKEESESSSEKQAIAHLFSAVQLESIGLYSSLQHASKTTLADGKLSILFSQEEAFHHQVVSKPDNQDRLSQLCAKIVGSVPKIEILLEESMVNQTDPTQNPKVKAFIKTFPGKVIVEREVEE